MIPTTARCVGDDIPKADLDTLESQITTLSIKVDQSFSDMQFRFTMLEKNMSIFSDNHILSTNLVTELKNRLLPQVNHTLSSLKSTTSNLTKATDCHYKDVVNSVARIKNHMIKV